MSIPNTQMTPHFQTLMSRPPKRRTDMRFKSAMLFALAPLAVAQGTMQLTLKRAVEIALAPEGSERVALARESVAQAESKIDQARHAFLPTLDASVQERSQTVNLRTFGLNFNFPGFAQPEL